MNNTTHGHKPIKNEQTGMNPQQVIKILTEHNLWRRGGEGVPTSPVKLGQAIDAAIEMIDRQLIQEQTVWAALKWLKQHHYLPQTESKLQEITKQLTDFLNEPF